MTSCMCCRATIVSKPMENTSSLSMKRVAVVFRGVVPYGTSTSSQLPVVRASMVDLYGSSSNFAKRMEQAWAISQGSTCCSDCKGTGFRAKWLGQPPISK